MQVSQAPCVINAMWVVVWCASVHVPSFSEISQSELRKRAVQRICGVETGPKQVEYFFLAFWGSTSPKNEPQSRPKKSLNKCKNKCAGVQSYEVSSALPQCDTLWTYLDVHLNGQSPALDPMHQQVLEMSLLFKCPTPTKIKLILGSHNIDRKLASQASHPGLFNCMYPH